MTVFVIGGVGIAVTCAFAATIHLLDAPGAHRKPAAWRRALRRVRDLDRLILRGYRTMRLWASILRGLRRRWYGLRERAGLAGQRLRNLTVRTALAPEDEDTLAWMREVAHPLPLTALGLVAALTLQHIIDEARAADPYPWLAPAWRDDPGTFRAICGGA